MQILLPVCYPGVPHPHPRPPALGYLWLNPVDRPIKGESYLTVVRYQLKLKKKKDLTEVKGDSQLPWTGRRTCESPGHDSLGFVCFSFSETSHSNSGSSGPGEGMPRGRWSTVLPGGLSLSVSIQMVLVQELAPKLWAPTLGGLADLGSQPLPPLSSLLPGAAN